MNEVERPVIPVADQTDPVAEPAPEAAGDDAGSFMQSAASDGTPANAPSNAHALPMTGDDAATRAAAGAMGQEGEPTLETRAVWSASPVDSPAQKQPEGGEQLEAAEPAAAGAPGIRSDAEAERNDTGRTGFVGTHPAGDPETPAPQEHGFEAYARAGEGEHAGILALDAIAEGASDLAGQRHTTISMLGPPSAGPDPSDRLAAEPGTSAQPSAEPDEAALRLAEAMVFPARRRFRCAPLARCCQRRWTRKPWSTPCAPATPGVAWNWLTWAAACSSAPRRTLPRTCAR